MGARQPIPLKILKGRSATTDVAGRPIPTPPPFARDAPEPPDWLTPAARELWDKVAPGLARLDLLKPEDYSAFVGYCETWATWREALIEVRCGGLVVTSAKGMSHKNPSLAVLEVANMQLLRYAQEFGLTPAAEVRISKPAVVDDDADDPFAEEKHA